MRRSKIVSTLGPASSQESTLRELIDAGVDVFRINCSHGSLEEHAQRISLVRHLTQDLLRPVAILVDLQGPKIRLGTFANGSEVLIKGQTFTITTRDVPGSAEIVSTTFEKLPADCSPGDVLLIDDGNVQVRVTEVNPTEVITTVETGGKVSNHKGLNLPGVAVSVPALSEKDREDLRWALTQEVDYIALSFVRSAADIQDVHAIMDEVGTRLPVLAKIEKPQAVEHLAEIVQAFDGIMVARGDLGVEMPLEMVPVVQKTAIELARTEAKPVIVATQVLESMIHNPRPTRAEASDCANAIWDGADAVMLSGETAVGTYPVQAVQTMAGIIEAVEEKAATKIAAVKGSFVDLESAIANSAVRIGTKIEAALVGAFTESGVTARSLARTRATIPLYAFPYSEKTRRQLALVWGIHSLRVDVSGTMDAMIHAAENILLEHDLIEPGQFIVYVGGMPPGVMRNTNSIRVHRVGDAAYL